MTSRNALANCALTKASLFTIGISAMALLSILAFAPLTALADNAWWDYAPPGDSTNPVTFTFSDQPGVPFGIHGGDRWTRTETVSFKNTTDKVISAIQFRLTVLDTFGDQLATYYIERTGTFSPGAQIDGGVNPLFGQGAGFMYVESDEWGSTAAGIACQLTKAMFADGTIWEAPTDELQQQISAEALQSYRLNSKRC